MFLKGAGDRGVTLEQPANDAPWFTPWVVLPISWVPFSAAAFRDEGAHTCAPCHNSGSQPHPAAPLQPLKGVSSVPIIRNSRGMYMSCVCVCALVRVCGILPYRILGRIKRSTRVWVGWVLFLFGKYLFTYLFIWLCWFLFAAHRIFHLYCSMQDLFSYSMQTPSCDMRGVVPWPGIESGSSAQEVQSLSHWTTREVPRFVLIKHLLS